MSHSEVTMLPTNFAVWVLRGSRKSSGTPELLAVSQSLRGLDEAAKHFEVTHHNLTAEYMFVTS